MADGRSSKPGLETLHRPIAHDSAERHVSGTALYVDDIPEPRGLLHLQLGLSVHAHAKIIELDLSEVAAAPGIVSVLTYADIPGRNDVAPIFGDDPLFAEDMVVYHGQSVFGVAAETLAAARAAARLANIAYDPLPAVLTIEEARRAQSLLEPAQTMSLGDASAALKTSAYRLSGQIALGGQDHFYLEGQVAMAIPLEGGDLKVYSSTQNPTETQHLVAALLGLPDAAVTVEVRRMGGGFGGKETQSALVAAAAALSAHKTGRPSKLCLDRDDDMVLTGKRHDFEASYDVGFDETGLIEGIRIELSARCGCSADLSLAINDRAMFHADNCYFLKNAEIVSHRYKTNTVSNTAFRGFGGPQGMMVIERVMDRIAAHLGRDPADIRYANLYRAPERAKTPYHQSVEDSVADDLIDELMESASYRERRQQIDKYNAAHSYSKKGIALTPVKFGISFTTTHLNQAGALIHLYTDGSIHLNHGGTEMGQGLMTKVSQIVADAFKVDLRAVKVTPTSTDKVPNTSATAASAGTDLNGMAALDAAGKLKKRLAEFGAELFACKPEDIVFEAGQVLGGGEAMEFAEFVRAAYLSRISLSATGFYKTPKIHYDRSAHRGRPFFTSPTEQRFQRF